jgi:hypothetical protein
MHRSSPNRGDHAPVAIVPSPAGSTITLASPWRDSEVKLTFILLSTSKTPEVSPDATRPQMAAR